MSRRYRGGGDRGVGLEERLRVQTGRTEWEFWALIGTIEFNLREDTSKSCLALRVKTLQALR